MGQGAESGHVGNLGNIVLVFLDELCSPVELIVLEEHARIFSGQTFHLILDFGPRDMKSFRHSSNIQFVI